MGTPLATLVPARPPSTNDPLPNNDWADGRAAESKTTFNLIYAPRILASPGVPSGSDRVWFFRRRPSADHLIGSGCQARQTDPHHLGGKGPHHSGLALQCSRGFCQGLSLSERRSHGSNGS